MKKLLNKIKDIVIEYKSELKLGALTLIIGMFVISCLFNWVLVVMTDDLVGRVREQELEINELKESVRLRDIAIDDLNQMYEDVVPFEQYLDEIEYLESVIRELRGEDYE